MSIVLKPSNTCLELHKDIPLYQIRQGLNNCCYRICDELNNPYGNNELYNKCNNDCHNFSNTMIKQMGHSPCDYKNQFVKPPTHLKTTNALEFIHSNNFLNKCIKSCNNQNCVNMCENINKSIISNKNPVSKSIKVLNNQKNDKPNDNQNDNQTNIDTSVFIFVIFFVVLLFILNK